MAEIVYNNAKNTNTGNMQFQFNCGYHFYIFFEEKANICS